MIVEHEAQRLKLYEVQGYLKATGHNLDNFYHTDYGWVYRYHEGKIVMGNTLTEVLELMRGE